MDGAGWAAARTYAEYRLGNIFRRAVNARGLEVPTITTLHHLDATEKILQAP